MSYKEKRVLMGLIPGLIITVAYAIYAWGQYQLGLASPSDLRWWSITILKFIGWGIVAAIAFQIVFHILMAISVAIGKKMENKDFPDEEIEKSVNAEMVEDEMDKLIELKAMRFAFAAFGVGFIAALVSLALGYPGAWMLNILFFSCSIGALLEGFVQIVYYRRGV